MYYIIVYDVNEERVAKVHKILKRYLYWRQRSVFEGELTDSQLHELLKRLSKVIDESEDSILIYAVKDRKLISFSYLGVAFHEDDAVI
ncbi:CRISPR-associated endonuclease Cas2 [Thermococcus sp. LS2]|uniref:CRISPR-associated endonuclease Cas2 n=1 Tax=Thermococcus sp. LS2 TaxID=1638260 RepID=UPI00143B69B9|nr:CRISPR-associated endonuclease Cas2 [Thermococcus sp. LS2]NJE13338.1 CRISPR-associated endonuclease Cas2 [Thermococcus sp. LS2]